jgi:O-antigen/teichoic acid export membrane protein
VTPRFLRNLLTNWAGYFGNVVVAFFLTPFIARSLGEAGYGVWSLLMAVTGYLGLVDLGVRVSTGRYLNFYLGRQDHEKARDVVRTSLALYSILGVVIVIASIVIGQSFATLFPKLPPHLADSAIVVLPLLGVNVWIGLYAATFSQVLLANNRFDIKNAIDMVVLAARTIGTVVVLRQGNNLGGLALVLVIAGAIDCVTTFILSRIWGISIGRLAPRIDREQLRALVSFSAWSFVGNVGSRVILYTDSIVIAALLGASDLAVYAIGLMVIDYAANFLAQVASVATPDIYKIAGSGNVKELQQIVLAVAETTLAVSVPALVCLVLLAPDFATLWMGMPYRNAGWIIRILAVGHVALLASRSIGAALWGAGEVKVLAAATAIEAASNLTCSVLFVTVAGWGIYGIAVGTALPMAIHTGVFLPLFASRRIGLSLRSLWKIIGRWVTSGIGFGLIGLVLLRVSPVHTWVDFIRTCLALVLMYVPIGVMTLGGPAGVRRRFSAVGFVSGSRSTRNDDLIA